MKFRSLQFIDYWYVNPKNSYKKHKIGCKILIFMVLKYKTTILKTPNFEP